MDIQFFNIQKTLNDDNIFNINAERKYREAEDYFFYFDRADLALKLLKSALKLSATHVKSMKLIADIYYSNGKIKKAFDYYSQAAALQPCDVSVLSSLAVVCEALNKNENALDFINLAFEHYSSKNIKIYSQMCDLKFLLLLKMKKYSEAKKFFDKINKTIPYDEFKMVTVARNSETLQKKLLLKERMENLHIKVV